MFAYQGMEGEAGPTGGASFPWSDVAISNAWLRLPYFTYNKETDTYVTNLMGPWTGPEGWTMGYVLGAGRFDVIVEAASLMGPFLTWHKAMCADRSGQDPGRDSREGADVDTAQALEECIAKLMAVWRGAGKPSSMPEGSDAAPQPVSDGTCQAFSRQEKDDMAAYFADNLLKHVADLELSHMMTPRVQRDMWDDEKILGKWSFAISMIETAAVIHLIATILTPGKLSRSLLERAASIQNLWTHHISELKNKTNVDLQNAIADGALKTDKAYDLVVSLYLALESWNWPFDGRGADDLIKCLAMAKHVFETEGNRVPSQVEKGLKAFTQVVLGLGGPNLLCRVNDHKKAHPHKCEN